MMMLIESCRKRSYVHISRRTRVEGDMYLGTARYDDFTILGENAANLPVPGYGDRASYTGISNK
jgi:hypothetical protein